MTMLAIAGLRSGYGKIEVLHGVDLTVARGQIVALIGANGAGKTTLLKTISGLIRPAAGTIAFAGEDIAGGRLTASSASGSATYPKGVPCSNA
jgi:branched-chain amino acid transport system ATP-binding protein